MRLIITVVWSALAPWHAAGLRGNARPGQRAQSAKSSIDKKPLQSVEEQHPIKGAAAPQELSEEALGLRRVHVDDVWVYEGKTVVELGCGCGLASIVAAKAGAAKAVATDVSAEALSLASRAADAQGVSIETCVFDVRGARDVIPRDFDILCAADMFDDVSLAACKPRRIGVRVVRALRLGREVIVATADGDDPQAVNAFLDLVRAADVVDEAKLVFHAVPRLVAHWKAKEAAVLHLNHPKWLSPFRGHNS
ncbi:hypothetical protein M885DRAFT_613018 [Pelagophyceae sp. CCMP2097]|nr:hypothetical protein M885DRAFT_613018 [Pelagophyceae sp. CCMP2097]